MALTPYEQRDADRRAWLRAQAISLGTLDAASRQGAPRQAGTATEDPTGQVRRDLEMLGIMTSVRLLTPASAGHAVRILVGDGHATGALHLEPQQAAALAHQLLADAQDAIYADRAVRRA